MIGDLAPETYFVNYEDIEVHCLMLSDQPRIEAYKNAIFSHQDYFKDKVVMDVGAGTGILALFCAQVGAKKVYAVEASKLAMIMEKVVQDNKFSHIIQVLHSRVEDVVLPDGEKVDVIVSEWMGFYLLHEGMLDSVLTARDHHLKPDGKMFPEMATLYACPCSLPKLWDFWEDVRGVNMTAVGREHRKAKSSQPEVVQVQAQDLLADPSIVCTFDLATASVTDLDKFSVKYVVPASHKGRYQGLCVWFSCTFPRPDPEAEPVVLSTSPADPPTHWKQTAIVLPNELVVEEGEPIAWELNLTRSDDNHRHYNLQLTMLDPEIEKHQVPCYCYRTKCIVIRTFLEQSKDEPGLESCDDSSNSEEGNE